MIYIHFGGLSRFAAEHWKHLRTTNVIESSFETVRHPHSALQGCLSNKAALAMIFKLGAAAERNWRRLDGHNQLPKVILGVKFTDGSEVASGEHANIRLKSTNVTYK
jgi:putative transposase